MDSIPSEAPAEVNRISPASSGSCAIGIDVGGTKTAAGIIDGHGQVLARRVIPTQPQRGGEAVLLEVLALAEELQRQSRRLGLTLAGWGVGLCELVSPTGLVLSEQTIAWRGLPVLERLTQFAPAILEADSRAAGFAEARCGAGSPFKSFLYVTIGTGIGSSLILNGVPWAGAHGCTGTLATAPMSIWCRDCGKLTHAVLEEVASGPALAARYNRQAAAKMASAEQVLTAAENGDTLARTVVDTAAAAVGATIALLVNVLDVEAVVVGGGLGSAPGLFWERLTQATRSHIWSDVHRELPLLQASLGGDAGWVGAALLALYALEKEFA